MLGMGFCLKQEQVRGLGGRSHPQPRSKLAGWDVESRGMVLLPEVEPMHSGYVFSLLGV